MDKQGLIDRTIEALEKLPSERVYEIANFADYILKKYEEQILQTGIETIADNSESFSFLKDEADLYDESDLKERY